MLTRAKAAADAQTVFRDHVPTGGRVESREARFDEKDGRFEIQVEAHYPDGSSKHGAVYLREDRGYALCIHSVYAPNSGWSFPHSWDHGFIH